MNQNNLNDQKVDFGKKFSAITISRDDLELVMDKKRARRLGRKLTDKDMQILAALISDGYITGGFTEDLRAGLQRFFPEEDFGSVCSKKI